MTRNSGGTTTDESRPPLHAPPRLSIIVPARNEARNLEIVLPELPAVHEVILVDGHSVDDTVATARRVMPSIRVVHQTRRGKGNALACGFAAATGDIIVMFDADGSADPAEIPLFVAALTAGADFAKGSRFCAGGGSHDITRIRRVGNAFLNVLTNRLFRTAFTDLCYGYNAFWRHVVPALDLPPHRVMTPQARPVRGDGFEIETMINCRVAAAGLKIAEVPSVERLRVYGESNLHAVKDGLRVLRTLWEEKRLMTANRRRLALGAGYDRLPTPYPPGATIDLTAGEAPRQAAVPAAPAARRDDALVEETA